jgi:glycosyltransferase involved in cell wall biosynthesis
MSLDGKKPKVSVCVVTYNQEKYIRQCLQSIVDQETDFEFEVLVGDDCSSDNTRDILKSFAEKYPKIIKPIYQEVNLGAGCQNYLSIHRAAIGDYVAHIDGDDQCLPNRLASQSQFLDQNPDCIAVVHQLSKMDSDGKPLPGLWPEKFERAKYQLADMVTAHPAFGHSSLMYRNGAYADLSYQTLPQFIDFYLYVHLAVQGKIGALAQVLGKYTCGVGVSSSNSLYALAVEALEYAKKVGLPEKTYQTALSRQYLLFAKKALVEKKIVLFKAMISKSMDVKYLSLQQGFLYALRENQVLLDIGLDIHRFIKYKL